MADDELRRLLRSTDPADVARLAHALARAGRAADALEASLRALLTSPDDEALRGLLPLSSTAVVSDGAPRFVPWMGLRAPTTARGVPFGSTSGFHSRLHDAGRGIVLVSHMVEGLAAFDAVRGEFLWTQPARFDPRVTTPDGVLATAGAEVHRLDPRTGATKPLAWEFDLGRAVRGQVGRIDDDLLVALDEGVVLLFEPSSGRIRARLAVGPDAQHLVTDPAGFVVHDGAAARSFDRSGRPRWRAVEGSLPLGRCDGRVFLAGVGETLIVSEANGSIERRVSVATSEPMLITRDALLFINARLHAFDRRTLRHLWSSHPLRGRGNLAATADSLLVLGDLGLRALDPLTGAELASVDLGARRAGGGGLPIAGKLVFPAADGAGVIVVE